jgi:signal transduction histidine kinase
MKPVTEPRADNLADERAALLRVATLVAQGARPMDVFWAVSDEVGRLFRTEFAAVGKFEPEGRALDLVGAGRTHERWEVADFLASAEVFRTGRSARADATRWESEEGETAERLRSLGIVSSVASPIVVEGELWGAMLVASTDALLPVDTEERLEKFTELVTTAIANAESRDELARVAAEQAALRRVATMVAQGLPASELFGAVACEVGALLGTDFAGIGRFEADAVIAVASSNETKLPTGTRWEIDDASASAQVYRTGRSVRVDGVEWSHVRGPLSAASARLGVVSTVASPIIVDGRTWGAVSVSSTHEALPPDTEERLETFTELVVTAIANAESKSELAASRRRIVAASDEARRRIERDLHDGVQQRLVSLRLELQEMKGAMPRDHGLEAQLGRIADGLDGALDDLVEIARGIHPAILSHGGLRPALGALARRSAVPVELEADMEGRFPEDVEVAAYYIVSEALTNVAKHAGASVVQLDVVADETSVRLSIRDDGVGGADSGRGSGLVGLKDRVEVLGGRITVESPPDGGTSLVVALPLEQLHD